MDGLRKQSSGLVGPEAYLMVCTGGHWLTAVTIKVKFGASNPRELGIYLYFSKIHYGGLQRTERITKSRETDSSKAEAESYLFNCF